MLTREHYTRLGALGINDVSKLFQDEERQKAHEAWLAEREEKKMAIQAALKAHSAKIPLKGAAAAAASAAQAR